MMDLFKASAAEFSPCRRWRYRLERTWDARLPRIAVCGLNPSIADERQDDPTVRRWTAFARDWGYGGLVVVNLFGWRSTDPRALTGVDDLVGTGNDSAITRAAGESAEFLACWGSWGDAFRWRVERMRVLLAGRRVICLGTTRSGQPRHPLYLPRSTERLLFWVAA